MIVESCDYDPVRDIAPVDQFGFIDLKTALDQSIVPSQMPGSDSDYNGIDEPDKVIGRPRDVFEAIEAQKAYEAVSSSGFGSEGEGQPDA